MSESKTPRREYETVRPLGNETRKGAEDPKAELHQFGTEGWDVTTIDYEGGGTNHLVFERSPRSSESV